jgi:hypothetical protein
MQPLFENPNEAETDFFHRMQDATQEQRDGFRAGLNVLMQCFGPNAQGSVLALHAQRDTGTVLLHAFNLQPEETEHLLQAALEYLRTHSPATSTLVQ